MTETMLAKCTADLRPDHVAALRTAVERELADDRDGHRLAQIRAELRRLGAADLVLEFVTVSARRQLRQRRVLAGWGLVAALIGNRPEDIEEVLVRLAGDPEQPS